MIHVMMRLDYVLRIDTNIGPTPNKLGRSYVITLRERESSLLHLNSESEN